MTTIPHQTHFLYALTEDVDEFAWETVRYIGITVNPEYRYHQHLTLHPSNEDKDEWIRTCLTSGKTPRMFILEEIPPSINAREREQFAIRYAMRQGAHLFNRAITYTDRERIHAHQRQAVKYAGIAEILASGVYVKQLTGNFYPTHLRGRYTPPLTNPPVTLVNLHRLFFETQENEVRSIYEATDSEFNSFICRYIPIYPDDSERWMQEERRNAIEFARYFVGGTLDLFLKEKP